VTGAGRTGAAFAIRGLVEGFYGRPWTHVQRLEMIEFIGRRGMNRFLYAPKDDPYLRSGWQRPYPEAELGRIGELVGAGAAVGVEFQYCLSPGLSIRYSSAADRELALAKLLAVAAVGVRHFGLLLDDIPQRLQHEADLAEFSSLAEAQVALGNEVYRRLRSAIPDATLAVCPTQYWGYGNEPYLTDLGHGLDQRIELFWTGRAICSATLDVADAKVFTAATGRPPLYWDNYPVNDVAMGHELHLGPYRGREADLADHAAGVIVNPMELFESSKIPVATICDYLRSPWDYDPEVSWQAAVRDVAGAESDAFADFADNVRSSCLSASDAPALCYALEELTFGSLIGDQQRALATLAPLAVRLRAAADRLAGPGPSNPGLIAEAQPWLESFGIGVSALEELSALVAADRLEQDGPRRLAPYLAALRERRFRVFGDVLDMTLDGICHPALDSLPALTQEER
jgi:hyaluronoglucosaminidase